MISQESSNGIIILQGKLKLLIDGMEIEATDLHIRVYRFFNPSDTASKDFKDGDTYRISNGTLSKNEDGSFLISGTDTSRAVIEKISGSGDPNEGLLIEFQGSVSLDEITQTSPVSISMMSYASDTDFTSNSNTNNTNADDTVSGYMGDSALVQGYGTYETPDPAEAERPMETEQSAETINPADVETVVHSELPAVPEVEDTIDVSWEDDALCITGEINFHAVDTGTGWHPEEHASTLKIRTPGLENDFEAFKENLSEDCLFQIRGGVCTKQEGGSVLLIEGDADDRLSFIFPSASPEHTQHEGLCVEYEGTLGPSGEAVGGFSAWLYGGTLLAAALFGAIISAFFVARKKKRKAGYAAQEQTDASRLPLASGQMPTAVSAGQCQHIGRRSAQQDSKGLFKINGGICAVVADGMGGLQDGDKVSQKIVKTIGEDCRTLSADQIRGNLAAIITHANDEVNRMLGPNDLYKSGSTTVAVLAELQQFQWISVGDSRIYLYRGGRLLQLNREHDFEADLRMRAINHQTSFQEAMANPKRKSVSSFIGMGNLKYVDEARRPIKTIKGDRIMLCSDGVFNTLTEPQIEKILGENPEPNAAAANLETAVLQANNPHQDNFTAIIIGYE